MQEQKIIEKIKKILELSRNNPSQEEAQAVALKAQRLMAEYHISMSDVDAVENVDEISEIEVNVGTGSKWKYSLANIVSKNFRCKHFMYGKDRVVFYGFKVDAEIASETFKFLFTAGNKSANNYYMKLRNEAKRNGCYFSGNGIKNSFLMGYMRGISEGLDKQCTALMIVTPPEVEESYKERSTNFRTIHHKALNTEGYYSRRSYDTGIVTGRNTIDSRRITVAV